MSSIINQIVQPAPRATLPGGLGLWGQEPRVMVPIFIIRKLLVRGLFTQNISLRNKVNRRVPREGSPKWNIQFFRRCFPEKLELRTVYK